MNLYDATTYERYQYFKEDGMKKFLRVNVLLVGFFPISLLIFGLIMASNGIADDSDSQISRETKERVLTEGIETGYVIALGRPIKLPYRVTMKSNNIFINEFQVVPRKTRGEKELKKVEISESTRNKHQLIQAIFKSYGDWVIESNVKKAKSKLIAFLSNQPLIKNYELKGESLLITFTDGNSEELLLHAARMRREGKFPSQSELEKMRLNICRKFEGHLRKGGIIAFGYDYTLLIPSLSAKENILFVRSTLSKSISEGEKSELLQSTFKKKAFVKDLISNQHSW
jgi:hypothetical protein